MPPGDLISQQQLGPGHLDGSRSGAGVGEQLRLGEHQPGAGQCEQLGQPGDRRPGREPDVHQPGPRAGPDRDRRLEPVAQQDRDPVPGLQAAGQQPGGGALDEPRKGVVRHLGAQRRVDEQDVVAAGGEPVLEHLHDRAGAVGVAPHRDAADQLLDEPHKRVTTCLSRV